MSVDIPIGVRIRLFREAKNLTQLQVAMRTGLSEVYVGMVERGDRTPSGFALGAFARCFSITQDVLLGRGQDVPDGHAAVPEIRAAMLGLGDYGAPAGIDSVRQQVESLGDAWFHAASFDQAGAMLPRAIRHVEQLRSLLTTPQEEPERREAARLAFMTYFIANHFANDAAAADLAISTRERMLLAADATDELVTMTCARWLTGLKLIKEGHLDTSEHVIRHQMEELTSGADELTRQSLLGMLNAAASIVAIRKGDLQQARRHADDALRIAERTGENSINYSAWGPTNVGIYHVELEAEHGNPQDGIRVAETITDVQLAAMPIAERRSHYWTLLAWLHDQDEQPAGVILNLRRAHQEAPDDFAYSRIVQTLIGKLLRQARSVHRRELLELATAAGMIA